MATIALASWVLDVTRALEPVDLALFDAGVAFNRWRAAPQPATADPVIVGIDEDFLKATDEPLALSHFTLARFLDAAVLGDAHAIGLQMPLPDKAITTLRRRDQPKVDMHQTLLAALRRNGRQAPIVVARGWDEPGQHFVPVHLDFVNTLNSLAPQRRSFASSLFCDDADGVVRQLPVGDSCQQDASDATFAGELAAVQGYSPGGPGRLDFQRGEPFNYVPLLRVLELGARRDKAALQHLFSDRVVLLGSVFRDAEMVTLPIPMASWTPDSRRVPGVVAHAQAIRSLTNHGLIGDADRGWRLGACLAFALLWLIGPARWRGLAFVVAAAGAVALSAHLLWDGLWLPPATALATGLFAWLGRGAFDTVRMYERQRRISEAFAGYVSPEVLREVARGGASGSLAGQRRHVCVLFSDIRGFTAMSEDLTPEEVVRLLNRYFERMTDAVHRNGGTLDKFIGDGLMAFFGAPNHLANPSENALRAAKDMMSALSDLNFEFTDENRPTLSIGIGVHAGDAIVGTIGSTTRHEYTAIGDTVNTASRLEGLCKELGYAIICSQTVVDAVGGSASLLVPLGERPIKGHSPIGVYGAFSTVAAKPKATAAPLVAVTV